MELSQPRSFLPEGKKATHDFLSLYSHPNFQDPRSSSTSSPVGIYPKTRNFLQPLEMGGNNPNGGTTVDTFAAEKPPPSIPSSSSASSVEHVLPGGIGTYTISQIPNFSQLVPKPESPIFATVRAGSVEINGEVNKATSNSHFYSGGSFTLWEEQAKDKAAKVKDSTGEARVLRETSDKLGQWSTDLHTPFNHRNSFGSLQNFKKSPPKHRSFMDMMKPGKSCQEDEDDEEEFTVKDGTSSCRELIVKVDNKAADQKANTPRSKHSATEQRRRSKINDRFQILREIIPQTDQKRDKASFLLEVIEYIQFLQEKVDKYDASYRGCNHESTNLASLKIGHVGRETILDQSRVMKDGSITALTFAGNLKDNIVATPPVITNSQFPVESDRNMVTAFKPISLQPNVSNAVGSACGLTETAQRLIFDEENLVSQPPSSQLLQNKMCASTTKFSPSNSLKNGEELKIEGGTISISSAYSHGLLNNLTQALESSGVDLSQASISVQIVLGKQPISRTTTTTSGAMGEEDPSFSSKLTVRPRVGDSGDDSDQSSKRLKMENS